MGTSVPTRKHRFRKRHRVLLALVSALFALFVAEVAVRTLNLAPRVFPRWLSSERTAYQRSENPILGYDLKASYRDPDADTHESFPSTNSHGLRDIERTLEKPEGVLRVVLLGDSIVAGHGILDLEDTISQKLERRLSEQPVASLEASGQRIEVLNFGMGGYCTRAEVELLQTRALAFNPDLVILLFVANDYEDFNGQVAHYTELPPLFIRHLFLRSHLFRITCLKLAWEHYKLAESYAKTDDVEFRLRLARCYFDLASRLQESVNSTTAIDSTSPLDILQKAARLVPPDSQAAREIAERLNQFATP